MPSDSHPREFSGRTCSHWSPSRLSNFANIATARTIDTSVLAERDNADDEAIVARNQRDNQRAEERDEDDVGKERHAI